MKNTFILKLIVILFIFSPAICFSKEKNYSYELEFGDPAAQKIVQIGGNGDLNITGYEGKKILISANENIFEEDNEVTEKTKGLKKIGGSGFQINNKKNENCIVISRSIFGKKIDLDIKVPNNITLRIGGGSIFKPQNFNSQANIPPVATPPVENGVIAGNIYIKDLTGTIEVSTVVGNIDMENIEGEVTASSVQGNLKIVFNKIRKENALYFSTVNGEIDITLPKKTAADIIAKTLNGNVYSGFDAEITTKNVAGDQTEEPGLPNFVTAFLNPNNITLRINGGGQEIYLRTINGNIYIRKGE